MIDLGALALTAVNALAGYLAMKGADFADKAVDAAGDKVLEWLKRKMTGKGAEAALEQLGKEPNSEEARIELQDLLVARLNREPALANELSQLLNDLKIETTKTEQTSAQSGQGNKSVQVAGKENIVKIS